MPNYVVIHDYPTPFSDERHNEEASRLDPCIKARGVVWVRSLLTADRLHMYCQFEAESAEAIREAHRSGEVSFEAVYPVTVYQR